MHFLYALKMYLRLFFFSKLPFQIFSSKIPSENQTVWIQIRPEADGSRLGIVFLYKTDLHVHISNFEVGNHSYEADYNL